MVRVSDYDFESLQRIVTACVNKGYCILQRNGILYFYTING